MKLFPKFFSILTLVLAIAILGCAAEPTESKAAYGQLPGSLLFTLKNLNGEEVRLEDVLKNNQLVLLNFWASWCDPCREEIPDLIRLQEKYLEQGFVILGIDIGESPRKVAWFAERAGINYPILLDQDMRVAKAYGIVGIPTSLLINQQGEVLGAYNIYTYQMEEDIEVALL